MKYCKLLFLVVTTVSIVFSGCDSGGSGDSSSGGYEIGDVGPSGVGIVFYITDGGLHGMEVSPVDVATSGQWSNIIDELVTGTPLPRDFGEGLENTMAILAQAGHTDSAAQLCRNYRSTLEGDWYLPSLDELVAVYDNLHRPNLHYFPDENYVSSTENTATAVYSLTFGSPSFPTSHWISQAWSKSRNDCRVRAIRSF